MSSLTSRGTAAIGMADLVPRARMHGLKLLGAFQRICSPSIGSASAILEKPLREHAEVGRRMDRDEKPAHFLIG